MRGQLTHKLKTWKEFYDAVACGNKTFELRKFDRHFDVGDIVVIQQYDRETKTYTGKECEFTITYLLDKAEHFGLKKGYCILGLKRNFHFKNYDAQRTKS